MKLKPTPGATQPKKMKLELELYFNHPKEIAEKVWGVRQMIEDGCFVFEDINLKYVVLAKEEPVFRHETHNGINYAVFESKMNKDY